MKSPLATLIAYGAAFMAGAAIGSLSVHRSLDVAPDLPEEIAPVDLSTQNISHDTGGQCLAVLEEVEESVCM